MKKHAHYIGMIFVLFALTVCSSNASLELVDSNVKIVKDKSLLGSIVLTERENKGDEIIPTALFYEFTIKNTSNKTVGTEDRDKGIELKIEPNEKLQSILRGCDRI